MFPELFIHKSLARVLWPLMSCLNQVPVIRPGTPHRNPEHNPLCYESLVMCCAPYIYFNVRIDSLRYVVHDLQWMMMTFETCFTKRNIKSQSICSRLCKWLFDIRSYFSFMMLSNLIICTFSNNGDPLYSRRSSKMRCY